VKVRRLGAALAVALVLTAVVQIGCVGAKPEAGTSPAGPVAAAATGTGDSDAGTGTSSGTGSSGAKQSDVTGADLASIGKQLDAMQHELDSLNMPTDNDFSGAEGSIY
jgi:hypothetical protein